jgi:hypothetical protein
MSTPHPDIGDPEGNFRFAHAIQHDEHMRKLEAEERAQRAQHEADRALGARIRKLLEEEKGEKYPHRASSWHARIVIRRYDNDHSAAPQPCTPYYYCNVGDDQMSGMQPTLDDAVEACKSHV